jgi:hypothetical protein
MLKRICWTLLAVVAFFCITGWAQNKPMRFALAEAPSLPIPNLRLDQIARQYPAFKHKPFTSGFNAMVMPFHFTDDTTTNKADPAEAMAFSFLLSNDLDWSPESYCARHAYFVYRADPKLSAYLKDQYDPTAVSTLISRWKATHAVGGTLTRTDKGYTGQLQIFDRTGKCIKTIAFDTRQSFFDLLGDVSTAGLKFFGPPPCDELVKQLHSQRCKRPESIAALGNASLEHDRVSELKAFELLLEKDPDFADARYWVANQGGWLGFTDEQAQRERCLSLDSYLVAQALRPYFLYPVPPEYSDKKLRWLEQAARFYGEDSAAAAEATLALHQAQGSVSQEDWKRLYLACEKYPNDFIALDRLTRYFCDPALGCDPDMCISCCLAALQSRYQPGIGDMPFERGNATCTLLVQGRPELATIACGSPGWNRDPASIMLMLISLETAGLYNTALATYNDSATALTEPNPILLVHAGACAAFSGQRDQLKSIMKQHRRVLEDGNMLALLQAFADAMDGQQNQDDGIADLYKTATDDTKTLYLFFLSQRDLDRGTTDYLPDTKDEANNCPGERQAWILLDAYDRQHPQTDLADFYHTIEWLYPQDPFVKTACVDWANRHPDQAKAWPDVASLTSALKDIAPLQDFQTNAPASPEVMAAVKAKCSSWSIAAAVRQLTEAKQYDSARDIALRYANYARQVKPLDLRLWAGHLPYKVDECRDAAGK